MEGGSRQLSIEGIDYKYLLTDSRNSTITFSGEHEGLCVGVVDIVDSTKISAFLNNDGICKYYGTFINSMGTMVKEFGGRVVKNVGDSLLFYFPSKSTLGNYPPTLLDSLYCGQTMLRERDKVNMLMRQEKLPPLSYRISLDYGIVTTAKSQNSHTEDIFGPPVNICSKINHFAKPNNMVIGGDLYELIKSFKEFKFELIDEFSNGLKQHYPVYSVLPKSR